MKEKTVVRHCRDLIDRLGGRGMKTWAGGPMAHGGQPDIDGVLQGRAIKVEAKAPGKLANLTRLQARELELWRQAGAVTGVVTSADELMDLLVVHGWMVNDEDGAWQAGSDRFHLSCRLGCRAHQRQRQKAVGK